MLAENQIEALDDNILEISNVSVFFDSVQVLREVSVSAERGEVLAIIGPSGSGKSTLLRCINGLVNFQNGYIRVVTEMLPNLPSASGRSLRKARNRILNDVRKHAGMVFQSYNLFPHLTILQNVTIGPQVVKGEDQGESEERGMQLLNRVGLAGKEHEYPQRLSGGQQQRVGIARALAMNPKILLLDEITSALDPELVAEVLKVVSELAAAGQTMLLVTHELDFARSTADRILFMDDGRAVEVGPAAQILDDPQTERAQRFVHQVKGDQAI